MIITSPLPIPPKRPNNSLFIFLVFSSTKIVQGSEKHSNLFENVFPNRRHSYHLGGICRILRLETMATLAIATERWLFVVTQRTRGQNQPQKNSQNFSFCHYFPSKCKHLIINHKPTAFPQLAHFHFLSWRVFVSSVGKNASQDKLFWSIFKASNWHNINTILSTIGKIASTSKNH